MSRSLVVAVVGGGAAGTLAAIHLGAHPSDRPRRVVVIDPAPELGLGAAYGTRSSSHLLNVRAGAMSAFPDAPGHFLSWAEGQGVVTDGSAFLPRMLYGGYLRHALGGRAEHVRDRAVGVARGTSTAWTVTLSEGMTLDADALILATGNTVAPFPGAPAHPRIVTDPWAAGAIDDLRATREVVLVGSGLTAVDVALSLRDIGHRGTIRMVSSHGLLPEPHAPEPLPTVASFLQPGAAAATSVRVGVAAARAATARADDWRQVVDGLRPQTVALWRSLSLVERRRFVRHVARRWEVRRHRMAPQVAVAIADMRASGRLTVERGRASRLARSGERISVTITSGSDESGTEVDAVVLCVGPSTDPERDPFLATLLASGIVARHPLGIGVDVDDEGRVLNRAGTLQPPFWAMGSLRKGAEWESTAVPELRLQARDIAAAILGSGETVIPDGPRSSDGAAVSGRATESPTM